METQSEKYEGWVILELMGHRRIGGYVREVTVFGAPMARIDIPCDPPATQFYGGAAVFCMTPTTGGDRPRGGEDEYAGARAALGAPAARPREE